MLRDKAGIPIDYHLSIPSRSNWLAYLLQRAITKLEENGQMTVSDALYKADKEWLATHARGRHNG